MTSEQFTIFIESVPFILFMISLFMICVIEYRKAKEIGDWEKVSRLQGCILIIIMVIFIVGALISMNIHNDIRRYDAEYKKYDKAVKSDYALYYNGQRAEADGIGITRKNVSDFKIEIDDDKKVVRVKESRW